MKTISKFRENTIARLGQLEVPLHENLPLVSGKVKRSPQQVAERMIGLYVVLMLGSEVDPDELWEWIHSNGYDNYLSQKEEEFLRKEKLTEIDINVCSWAQESLHILGWYVSVFETVTRPDEESEIESLFELIPPEHGINQLINSYTVRDSFEVMQQVDLYYCLHGAINHPELWDSKKSMDKLVFAAIQERRKALEWLISDCNSWDSLTLDT